MVFLFLIKNFSEYIVYQMLVAHKNGYSSAWFTYFLQGVRFVTISVKKLHFNHY